MEDRTLAMVGVGNVGSALGRRLEQVGYRVIYGVRNPEAQREARESVGPKAEVASLRDAARQADLIFVAVPGSVVADAVGALGRLEGKIVVDCTNPTRWDSGPVWDPPASGSNAAEIDRLETGATVVKAFNTFGAEFHGEPEIGGGGVDVPMAGDDDDAKRVVAEVARRAGFLPFDAGPLRNASLLENLAILWIHLATVGGRGRNFAFRLQDRGD